MVPPWKKYPDIPLGSIGWRMGYGEDYMVEFNHWYARKHDAAKARYREENPEPPGWERFYEYRG